MAGNRNVLYLVIGVLLAVIGVLGYQLYQAKKQPEGFQINVGPDGLKIQGK
jgi:predicted negative regulator of RcsB-dependent stress response